MATQKQFEELMRRERFIHCASTFGLDPKWLGKTYRDGGRTFKIIGLSPKGKQVLLENLETGATTWRAPVDYVKVKMAKDPKAAEKAIQDEKEKEYRKDYKAFATILGLPANGIGKQFRDKKHVCTIIGLSWGRSSNVMVERNRSRSWRYPVELVRELLKSNPA